MKTIFNHQNFLYSGKQPIEALPFIFLMRETVRGGLESGLVLDLRDYEGGKATSSSGFCTNHRTIKSLWCSWCDDDSWLGETWVCFSTFHRFLQLQLEEAAEIKFPSDRNTAVCADQTRVVVVVLLFPLKTRCSCSFGAKLPLILQLVFSGFFGGDLLL